MFFILINVSLFNRMNRTKINLKSLSILKLLIIIGKVAVIIKKISFVINKHMLLMVENNNFPLYKINII